MAAKKFYAVRKGKITGVFSSWADCKSSVDGFPGAEYKGFATLDKAREYLGDTDEAETGCADKAQTIQNRTAQNTLLAYVDGSYNDSLKKYAFGCVFILPDGHIYTEYGNGDNPQSLEQRNVTGEMLGAMYAVKFAMFNGFRAIEIRYDYQGIEKWVTGEWRSKTELTQKYAAAMRGWSKSIAITFTKVAAHTNVKYNELADRMAKMGLTEGKGIPAVRKIEELTVYEEV